MGKKNLEQLFKDTFRDFGEVPDERVWQAIEVSLDHKKKRNRPLPLWWPLGGAAAAVAILLYVLSPFGPEAPGEVGPIIDVAPVISDIQERKGHDSKATKDQNSLQPTPTELPATDSLGEDRGGNPTFEPGSGKKATEVGGLANVGDPSHESPGESRERPRTNQAKGDRDERGQWALLADKRSKDSLGQEGLPGMDPNPTAEKEALAQNSQNPANKTPLGQDVPGKAETLTDQGQEKEGVEKKSIYEAITEMEAEAVAEAGPSGKWSVGPSVAPVYFGSSGQGSPINTEFSSNSKSGNFNLSYGLSVAYEVGKKVKIRTGIHKVKYGYDTNDVSFSTSMVATADRRFANIDYNRNSRGIIVESSSLRTANDFMPNPSASKEVVMNEVPVLDGKMVQQLGYIEVPLEVNYALVDQKFGVDLIGGLSSLFLVDNAVLLESRELVTEMGEANNVNSMNFSANVGMGLNHKFSPKLQFNLEPMFKYQLNTFSKTAGNFHPFSVGVYSGVSFRF